MALSSTLSDLLQFALSKLDQELPADIDAFLGDAGPQAASAVAKKMYLQQPTQYAGDPTAVGQDGKTNVERLAQDSFIEFRHYLRAGNGSYPGAPAIPALQTGADLVYAEGQFRSQIHTWCNAAASSVLSNPPTNPKTA